MVYPFSLTEIRIHVYYLLLLSCHHVFGSDAVKKEKRKGRKSDVPYLDDFKPSSALLTGVWNNLTLLKNRSQGLGYFY